MRLFDAISGLFRASSMVLDDQAVQDPVRALSQFVFGYAFEHQGRSPSYGPIAREVVETLAASAGFWEDPTSPLRVWESFCNRLLRLPSNTSPNPKINPLCPKGTQYGKQGHKQTRQLSVVQFAQSRLREQGYNIVFWAQSELRKDRGSAVHRELCSINGIGRKIASLFLRDLAWCLGIQVTNDRALLQPVDVWVRRGVRRLDPTAAGREAEWIVNQAQAADVSPEAANAGLWYFAALIVGNEFQLLKALDSPEYAHWMAQEYVDRLERQVRRWEGQQSSGIHS